MRVLALASQKGGSGKTTLSGHLAVQAQRAGAGPVVLIDIDPQGSLADWWNEREAEYPAFAHTTVARLAGDLATLRQQGFKLAVIDTPPAITMAIQSVISVAELIVGITRDAVFGPVMTVGTGGVLVELLKDSATLLLPASRTEIETALRGLKMFPLLDGYRGRPKADLPAAVDSIAGIAAFASARADSIVELDINPLIVCEAGRGAWIADALLMTDREEKACRTS